MFSPQGRAGPTAGAGGFDPRAIQSLVGMLGDQQQKRAMSMRGPTMRAAVMPQGNDAEQRHRMMAEMQRKMAQVRGQGGPQGRDSNFVSNMQKVGGAQRFGNPNAAMAALQGFLGARGGSLGGRPPMSGVFKPR